MERWQVETAVGGRCAVGAEAGAEPVEGLWKAGTRPERGPVEWPCEVPEGKHILTVNSWNVLS